MTRRAFSSTRETRGLKLYEKAKIVKIGDNEYRHQSESDKKKWYSVALPDDPDELGVCTCPDYLYNCLPNKLECKHVTSCKEFQKDLAANKITQEANTYIGDKVT